MDDEHIDLPETTLDKLRVLNDAWDALLWTLCAPFIDAITWMLRKLGLANSESTVNE